MPHLQQATAGRGGSSITKRTQKQETANDIGIAAMALSPVADVVAAKRKEREKLGTMSRQCCKR